MLDTFDAQQHALASMEQDVQDAPTTALLYRLRRDVLVPAWLCPEPNVRRKDLQDIIRELTRRGFDTDSLVRWGLRDRLVRAICAALVMTSLVPGGEEAFACRSLASWLGRKASDAPPAIGFHAFPAGTAPSLDDDQFDAMRLEMVAAGIDPDAVPEELTKEVVDRMSELAGTLGREIWRWVAGAPLVDILDWHHGTVDVLSIPELGLCEQYRWIFDRLTVTYYGQWAPSSLELEWSWVQGEIPPPCPVQEMAARAVDVDALSRALAEASADLSSVARKAGSAKLDQVNDQAIALVRANRRTDACALMKTAADAMPCNAEAANNYGFLALPDSPAIALESLQRAADLGFRQWDTNLLNRMQALVGLGQAADALRLAELALAAGVSRPTPIAAYLWAWTPDPVLVWVSYPPAAVSALAAQIAASLGRPDAANDWSKRHDDTCGQNSAADHGCVALMPPAARAA